MMRCLALLGFILMWLPVCAQNKAVDKNAPAKSATTKKDTASAQPAPVSTTETQVFTDEKEPPPAPPASNGNNPLFAGKNPVSGSSALVFEARATSADKTEPYMAMKTMMYNTTPEQLQSISYKEVFAVKPRIDVVDVKLFVTRNKIIPQPSMPRAVLASIKLQDSMRAVEMARAQQEFGNTDANEGSRRNMALNTVPTARLDPPDKMSTLPNQSLSGQDNVGSSQSKLGSLPTVPQARTPAVQQPTDNRNTASAANSGPNRIAFLRDSIKNAKQQKLSGNAANKATQVIVSPTEDKRTDPEKYVFDKTVFDEMDSKKYPIIMEIPKDSSAANVNSGDFPKPYTTRKKKVRLFLSADENVEPPENQIVTVRYPRLSIQIKVVDEVVSNIKDLKIMMTLTNNAGRTQKFLFDKPIKPGFAMWGGACKIVGSNRTYILRAEGKQEYEAREFVKKDFDHYAFKIKAGEWFIKKFSVADIVVVDDSVCPGGNLPRDTYSMQLVFQGNFSNVVTFTVN